MIDHDAERERLMKDLFSRREAAFLALTGSPHFWPWAGDAPTPEQEVERVAFEAPWSAEWAAIWLSHPKNYA